MAGSQILCFLNWAYSRIGIGRREMSEDLDLGNERLSPVSRIRRIVASNPNTPAVVLGRLAQDHDAIVRMAVAENPRTPSDILAMLAQDANSDVRLTVVENRNTWLVTLYRLAADDNDDVRYGMAECCHMPVEILLLLCDDENPYVRARASKTMRNTGHAERVCHLRSRPVSHLLGIA